MPATDPATGFLREPEPQSEATRALYDGEVEEVGLVMNRSRLWAHAPSLQTALSTVSWGAR